MDPRRLQYIRSGSRRIIKIDEVAGGPTHNCSDAPLPLVVAVAGPTASGKSALAIHLALRFSGEVINCDSMQVYRGFDIGTAKVPEGERRGVRHHLIDIREPQNAYSAGDFARDAAEAIAGITSRDRLPIVAGGTGFYFDALFDGLFEGPGRHEAYRRILARRSPKVLHALLQRQDPEAAQRIHPNDRNKLVRALEICRIERQPLTAAHERGRQGLTGYRVLRLVLDPPRADVYARIDVRCEQMFAAGLIEETARLSAEYPPHCQPFLGVGYRESLQVLAGELSTSEALAAAQQASRRYAKRQWTWFRRWPSAVRLDGFGDETRIFEAAASVVGEALKTRGQ